MTPLSGVQVLLRLGGGGVPVVQAAWFGAEHRPHGVDDLVVELGVVQAGHVPMFPLARGGVLQKVRGDTLGGGGGGLHAGRDADTA